MGIHDRDEGDVAESNSRMHFYYKGVTEHIACMAKHHWKILLATFLGALAAIAGSLETSEHFLAVEVTGPWAYAIVVGVSLAISLLWSVRVYVNSTPDGLGNESTVARRIAQLQRPHWEARLARQLLRDKLLPLDMQQSELLQGRVYVAATRKMDLEDYHLWMTVRPSNLMQMVEVAKRLVVEEVPDAIASRPGRPPDPKKVLLVIERLSDLYAEAVSFERESFTVLPPEGFETLHRLQRGWTKPIQNGIHQLFDLLDSMLASDAESGDRISFTFEFGEPPNVDEFCREADRLTGGMFGNV